MNMNLIQQVGKKYMKKVPVLKPGCTVRVHQKIKEGEKERIQVFEGLIIAINPGNGPNKTFTVRKLVGGIGVEKIFPLYSKNITKITVSKSSDIRRSKLYYMRKRSGKAARLKEKHLTDKDIVMEDVEEVEEIKEKKQETEAEKEVKQEEVIQEEPKKEKEQEQAKPEEPKQPEEKEESSKEKPEKEEESEEK